jgi:hypothetical protein
MRELRRGVRQPGHSVTAQGSERQLPPGDQSGCVRHDVHKRRMALGAGQAAAEREDAGMITATAVLAGVYIIVVLLTD